MASFTASSSSASGGGGGAARPEKMAPSSRSFFEDSHPPTAFTSMAEWIRIRNFLFYFGVVHRNKKQVDGAGHITFTDPRAIAYDIARMMNILQEDYRDRLSQVSLQGRLIAEAVVEYFAPPPSGYPKDQGKNLMIGAKINVLSSSGHVDASFKGSIIPALQAINKMGISGVHYTSQCISPNDKAVMVNAIFTVTSYLVAQFERRWSDESLEATVRASAKSGDHAWLTKDEEDTW